MYISFETQKYELLRQRLLAEDPTLDEQTLADTLEGITDLHELLAAVLRAALQDEAMAAGLKARIADMQERLARLQGRGSKRRQIARDAMAECGLKKIVAPDLTASLRPGGPAIEVVDEAAIPRPYWEPRDPRLNRQGLLEDLKAGVLVPGAELRTAEPVLSVRSK